MKHDYDFQRVHFFSYVRLSSLEEGLPYSRRERGGGKGHSVSQSRRPAPHQTGPSGVPPACSSMTFVERRLSFLGFRTPCFQALSGNKERNGDRVRVRCSPTSILKVWTLSRPWSNDNPTPHPRQWNSDIRFIFLPPGLLTCAAFVFLFHSELNPYHTNECKIFSGPHRHSGVVGFEP